MDENLRMKKFETASSNDLEPVMNCVGKCSARNCSDRRKLPVLVVLYLVVPLLDYMSQGVKKIL